MEKLFALVRKCFPSQGSRKTNLGTQVQNDYWHLETETDGVWIERRSDVYRNDIFTKSLFVVGFSIHPHNIIMFSGNLVICQDPDFTSWV